MSRTIIPAAFVAAIAASSAVPLGVLADSPATSHVPAPIARDAVRSRVQVPPTGLTREQWSQIRRSIQDSAYHVSPSAKLGEEPSLQGRNRQQAYRTTFRADGIEIIPQAPATTAWRLGLEVIGYGYEGDVRPVGSAEPRAEKERVEYRRGPLTEWYVNRPGGLEQGFELSEPQVREDGPLMVTMAVTGDLQISARDNSASFTRSAETLVRYEGLKAWDADGQPVVSRLEADGETLRLIVDADGARFPVTVDPTFVHEAQLFGHGDPAGQAGANVGYSVSVSGNTAVVGAPFENTAAGGDAGAAYVYVRSGTTWVQQQRLVASDAAANDLFGFSVALSGNTAVVGAYQDDTLAGAEAGSAYVFVRAGTTWTQQQKLLPTGGVALEFFGYSVSVDADTAVAGAYLSDAGGGSISDAGAVYVFVRSGTTWTQQQRLLASDAADSDYLGYSVAVSGNTLVAGSPLDDTPGVETGSAYVFTRSGTTWSQQQKLVASDGGNGDQFGVSVSVLADTALVGASTDDTAAGANAGSAYAFVRSGTTWTQQQKLLAADGAANDLFGSSVSVSTDTAAIGASGDDTAGGADAGSAYVYLRSGSTWSQQQKLLASDGAAIDAFGTSVSISGETVVVGAPLDDRPGIVDAGSAYAFVRTGTTWLAQQNLFVTDAVAGDQFGFSVAVSGDTAVVGAYQDDTAAGANAGSAYVFVRSGTVWSEQQKLLASDGAADDQFGFAVSIHGDTVVIGAPLDDTPGGSSAGSAYVFVRSGATWTEQQKLVASNGQPSNLFGRSVSISGDTAMVGAPFQGGPPFNATGGVYLFVRSGTAWSQQYHQIGLLPGFHLGISVSVWGDTAVAGADGSGTLAGEAWVFVRSGTTWSFQQGLSASDGGPSDFFGNSVSLSGETAVVAAFNIESAYVFVRSGTTWSEQQKLQASDGMPTDRFGFAVSIVADTVVVGAPQDDTPAGTNAGSAYVFTRSGTTWSEQQKLLAPNGAGGDQFGSSVSVSGDTASVGVPGDDTLGGAAGSAHVFRGAQADLGITKTDGQPTAVPGQPLTYTIVATNAGPSNTVGATVTDAFPAAFVGVTWTCGATGGASCAPGGSGNINDTVNLPSGGTVTYTATGTVPAGATGTLTNTATVTPPGTVTDPNPANNSATDTNTLTPTADLGITKTDGQTTVVPGQPVTYTIVASNPGPSNAPGATVTDTFPAALTGVTWTCVPAGGATCAPGGSGNINAAVSLPAGGSVTYLATGTVDAAATGSLSNTATVAAPGGVTDPNPANNSATDTDNLAPAADLGITKTDGQTIAMPGQPLTYTIVGSNPGPSNAPGTTVTDMFPPALTGVNWTCVAAGGATCPPGGSGNINTTVNLPAGGTVFFAATGTVDAGATGSLSNTATVTAPVGVADPNPANNSATDIDTIAAGADLAITKTDGLTTVAPGQPVTYTIVASNTGPGNATGATVADTFPAALTGVTWTCSAAGGASCAPGGTGSINDTVSLPVGGTTTYTATGTVAAGATGTLTNTATVTPPAGVTDPNPANNSATDIDTIGPASNLGITKTDSADPVSPGDPVTYALNVTNTGPAAATSVTVVDTLPAGMTFVSSNPPSPTCAAAGPVVTCTLGSLAAGGNVVVLINVTVNTPQGPGVLTNTATVSGAEPDPDPANNSATETTNVRGAKAELSHGARTVYDLAPLAGQAVEHVFLFSQKPFSSYEVVVDATSGDIGSGAGPLLQRMAPDGTTVLQSSTPVGTGSSRSLRWRNTAAAQVDNQTIRVRSAACGTNCGPDDIYRIRAYETTFAVPRFNNSGSQLTVLILQNPTNYTIAGEAYFQIQSGTQVATHAFTLNAKATLVLNTSTVPGANGVSGAITVAHDGRYGDLAGKTVALEPSTGFSFDSAVEPRRR